MPLDVWRRLARSGESRSSALVVPPTGFDHWVLWSRCRFTLGHWHDAGVWQVWAGLPPPSCSICSQASTSSSRVQHPLQGTPLSPLLLPSPSSQSGHLLLEWSIRNALAVSVLLRHSNCFFFLRRLLLNQGSSSSALRLCTPCSDTDFSLLQPTPWDCLVAAPPLPPPGSLASPLSHSPSTWQGVSFPFVKCLFPGKCMCKQRWERVDVLCLCCSPLHEQSP